MSRINRRTNRREFLRRVGTAGAMGAAGAVAASSVHSDPRLRFAPLAHAQTQREDPRFLVVLCGSGGANLLDSFLAVAASESNQADTINTYPDAMVKRYEDSPLRAIDNPGATLGALPLPYAANQSSFVQKHKNDIMVSTLTGTSVNHAVAQKRAVTGNEAWAGRTLQEIVSLQYGAGQPLPNVAMATGTAFIDRGTDNSLPTWAYGEPVANPALWPLGL
ncbi:MAG: twin-arginine translocation signal domain-containing protein, partial [Myxococcota bacterium]